MEQLTCDLCIIAAGPAGLAAACAAAQKGLDVIVVEKTNHVGGAGAMGMGILAVGSHIQEEQGTPVDPDEAFMKFMNFTHWKADARLVRKYFNKSADTICWLEDMGVEFFRAGGSMSPSALPTWHVVKPESGLTGPGVASRMLNIMKEYSEGLKARYLLNTSAKEILKENGQICGVQAEGKNGTEYQIRSKAVVVATGGCGINAEMVYEETGYRMGVDYFGHQVPGVEGDGLRMAWKAGAGKTPITLELTKKTPIPLATLANFACQLPGLMVDKTGRRFFNEEICNNSPYMGNALSNLPGRMCYLLFDHDSAYRVQERMKVPQTGLFNVKITSDDIDTEIRELETHNPHIFSADTLEELARKAGIDSGNLLETVKTYNQYCDQGYDPEFAKSPQSLEPVRTPRFYAACVYGGGYGTLGGIKADPDMQVQDENGKDIPGLFAAGNEVCTIYCGTYSMDLPGNSMGFAVNSGRIAGESAADYVLNNYKEEC